MKKYLLGLWFVLNDSPMWRVDYANGERTRPLRYREAKGCYDVFGSKLYIDWKLTNRWKV